MTAIVKRITLSMMMGLLATAAIAGDPSTPATKRTTATIGTSAELSGWTVVRTGSTLVFRPRRTQLENSAEVAARSSRTFPKVVPVRNIEGHANCASFAWDVLFLSKSSLVRKLTVVHVGVPTPDSPN